MAEAFRKAEGRAAMAIMIIREDDELTQVALSGSLNMKDIGEIEDEFFAHTVSRKLPVIVDISHVVFIMSAGINMLTQCYSSLKSHGVKMILVNPQDLVEQALRNVGLHKLIPIVRNRDEAMEHLRDE